MKKKNKSRVVQPWPGAPGPKVFEDASGLRRWAVLAITLLGLAVAVAWTAEFLWRVATIAPVGEVAAGQRVVVPPGGVGWPGEDGILPHSRALSEGRCSYSAREGVPHGVVAFLPQEDETARAAFRAHCGEIDAIIYEGLTLGLNGQVTRLPYLDVYDGLQGWLGTENLPPAHVLASPVLEMTGTGLMTRLLGAPGASRMAERLIDAAAGLGAAGVCLDLSAHPDVADIAIRRLVTAWSIRASMVEQEVCLVAGPEAEFWGDRETLDRIDHAVLLGFATADQPYPAAPLAYFDASVAPLARSVARDKLVLAPGSFGQLWRSGTRAPLRLSYADAMGLADLHDAAVRYSAETGNSLATFLDENRVRNQIWLADAPSFAHQMSGVDGIERLALWPLGYEDPALWRLLSAAPGAGQPGGLIAGPVALDDHVAQAGRGPFVTAITPARTGQRSVTMDSETGRASGVNYDVLPTPVRIERSGARPFGTLALTFLGLPDEEELAVLLAALDSRGLRAVFFLSAVDVLERDEEVAAIARAGHEFGTLALPSETTFPLSDGVRQFSLNWMQMQLAHETDRRTMFVREPYGRLASPNSPHDLALLRDVLRQGYVPVERGVWVVGSDDTPGLVRAVRRMVIEQPSNVLTVNLASEHNRGADVWLPALLDALTADGFEITPLSRFAGPEASFGAIAAPDASHGRDEITFDAFAALHGLLAIVLVAMLSLDLTRAVAYVSLAIARRRKSGFDPDFTPEVTVLIPAYNEAAVIERCLASVVRSDYPHMRIVVIDDGSTDETREIVQRRWSDDPRVTLLSEENQGKWRAENYALETVETEIFVAVDADTVLHRDAVSWMVQPFRDPEVGAVAGFVEVGNRNRLLTRFQALEYIVAQSLGRRATEVFNGVLVVPGAIGAWRTDAVRKAGLYSPSTITEDADLTVAVHRAGYRVRFEDRARAFTEAPESVRSLVKQRVRWALGMLQTSWKHRRSLAEGRTVGLISIVDAIWLGFVGSLVAPLFDLLLIMLIVQAGYTYAVFGISGLTLLEIIVIAGRFGLILIDIFTSFVAFRLDRRRDYGLLFLVPLSRLGYRQILIFASLMALVRAITGQLFGWHKLRRTGTVDVREGAVVLKR